MQARMIKPLAIGLATVLLSPLALAQAQQSTMGAQDSTSSTSQNATARQPMTPLNSDISISTFNHLDTNHDGHVTLAEARADSSFNSRFAALDADGNGYVSKSELKGQAKTTGNGAMGADASTTTYGNADDSNYESGTKTTTDTTTNSTNSSSDTSNPPEDQDSDDKTKSP